jgi:hypothetical protein
VGVGEQLERKERQKSECGKKRKKRNRGSGGDGGILLLSASVAAAMKLAVARGVWLVLRRYETELVHQPYLPFFNSSTSRVALPTFVRLGLSITLSSTSQFHNVTTSYTIKHPAAVL